MSSRDSSRLEFDEQLVFRVSMRTNGVGDASFVGMDAQSDPLHSVLVYGSNSTVPAKDIDFGEVSTRLAFDNLALATVPEPTASLLTALASAGLAFCRSKRQSL